MFFVWMGLQFYNLVGRHILYLFSRIMNKHEWVTWGFKMEDFPKPGKIHWEEFKYFYNLRQEKK